MRNDKPISISFRNNILDQCNDHYENQFQAQLPAGIPSASPMRVGASFDKSTPNTHKPSLSPYRRTDATVSPSQFNYTRNNEDEIDETI